MRNNKMPKDHDSSDDDAKVIDKDKLIREVEKRPALYNKQLKDYHDRSVREKLWEDISVKVIPKFNELSETERKNGAVDLQKKWKNMKDCFQRGLARRKTMSGQGAKKRRKYIHNDELSFLLPFIKATRGLCYSKKPEEHDSSSSNATDVNTNSGPTVIEVTPPIEARTNKIMIENVKSCERPLTPLPDVLKTTATQNEELSEDRHFALMLIPMLGKLNEEQKHYAKVEILNVMRNARFLNPEPQVVYNGSSSATNT